LPGSERGQDALQIDVMHRSRSNCACAIVVQIHAQNEKGPGDPGLSQQFGNATVQLMAKQYNLPAPPVLLSDCLLQPWLICAAFHDMFPPPVRSM
jgi:hypothetical protein